MQIFFPKEEDHEIRATILPEVAKKFTDLGIEVLIESGLGEKVFVTDELYVDAVSYTHLTLQTTPYV